MSKPRKAIFTLGQQVEVAAFLRRDGPRWTRTALEVPEVGIVAGYRNRNNGNWEHHLDEWSGKPYRVYVIDQVFQAVDVATNLFRSYTVALPSDVRAIDDDTRNGPRDAAAGEDRTVLLPLRGLPGTDPAVDGAPAGPLALGEVPLATRVLDPALVPAVGLAPGSGVAGAVGPAVVLIPEPPHDHFSRQCPSCRAEVQWDAHGGWYYCEECQRVYSGTVIASYRFNRQTQE